MMQIAIQLFSRFQGCGENIHRRHCVEIGNTCLTGCTAVQDEGMERMNQTACISCCFILVFLVVIAQITIRLYPAHRQYSTAVFFLDNALLFQKKQVLSDGFHTDMKRIRQFMIIHTAFFQQLFNNQLLSFLRR